MQSALDRPVRHNQHLTSQELQQEAVAAVRKSKRTQRAIAEAIGQSPATVSKALNPEYGSRYAQVQREIIALLTDFEVSDEPLFKVQRKGKDA